MALTLHLKYAENIRGKADRLAKVTFRGVSHYSKVVENAEETAWFDEVFEWPVARPIESEEIIDIQVFNYNKYLSNRLLGTFRMILQELVEVGNIKLSDSLLDANNVAMKTTLTFELTYNAPDGSVGLWQKEGFESLKHDLRRGLSEEEQNNLNLEKGSDSDSLPSSPSKSLRASRTSLASKTSSTRKTSHNLRHLSTVAKMMRLAAAKQRPPPDIDENQPLSEPADQQDLEEELSALDRQAAEMGARMMGQLDRDTMLMDEDQRSDRRGSASSLTLSGGTAKRFKVQHQMEPTALKAQDFQVCITVIEGRGLTGVNMDPVVCVQVGDNKQYTAVKESTNCPYYNEYFVFDFHMAPVMLFDKIITLTVKKARSFPNTDRVLDFHPLAREYYHMLTFANTIGYYQLDVGYVYRQPYHQFYHKWAVLTDPDDLNSGPKGYLKCDIAVIGKGDAVKVPPKSDKDEDDIEANLLLPAGVPIDRQRAKFVIRIYKAEGLPRMNTGIMSNVKKAFSGEFSAKDFVDPYVQVSFAGLKGKTSVKKGTHEPKWNEQVVFTEMFPPLCRRVKIQLRDHESVNYDVIGTHFLDLAKISDEGEKGFLPTFGPCWVNLYGSPRVFSLMSEHRHLNDGLGEGVSYRGRLLIGVKTEILENVESWPAAVEVEAALPISESAAGRPEEYFLFSTILEASMIDRKYGERPIHFEMSIGNAGNVLDGYRPSKHRDEDSSGEEGEESEEEEEEEDLSTKWNSTTPPLRPVTNDDVYYHMTYHEEKPCKYISESFEDHRRRMTNTNILEKIAEKLEDGIEDVNDMLQQEWPFPEKRLRGLFEELGSACSRFVSLVKGTSGGSSAGKTILDKKRHLLLVREMDHLSTLARTMKATVTKSNIKEKLKSANNYLQKLRNLSAEPQPGLPDVFIWMVSGNKRIAYQRVPAKDLIYSVVDEERGKNCGKVITLLLKLPGKRSTGQSGWAIQAKLQMYFWLGLSKHKKDYLSGLPKGYMETPEIKNAGKPQAPPPTVIPYKEKQSFQLRAHMYQARSIVGSDASGLSDPFARICFGSHSLSTQVIEETLSPTWDELLIMKEVVLYGVMEEIMDEPPTIIVELFDQDKVGKAEFIGRSLTTPSVKMSTEPYQSPKFPPRLKWWDIFRGEDKAGELLACFELLQLAAFGDLSGEDLPPMEIPDIGQDRGPIMPVPKGIRPILSKHRIEVLFWGVRDLKRVQLTSVDQPRVEIECGGQILQSVIIMNSKKNPNFSIPVKYFDVELPENELYCPPITIRCHDCRNFGRFVLVGTHVINSLQKFMYIPTTKSAKAALNKLFPGRAIDSPKIVGQASMRAEDVAITLDERKPLINRDALVTIDTVSAKDQKTEANKRRKRKDGAAEDSDLDLDALDWWSKYFASLETLIEDKGTAGDQEHERNREEQAGDPLDMDNRPVEAGPEGGANHPPDTTPYGTMPNGTGAPTSDGGSPDNEKEAKKMEKELKKMEKKDQESKKGFAGASKAVSLASKLSPKSQRKKGKSLFPAQLKVASRFNKMFRSDDGEYTEQFDDDDSHIERIRIYPSELENQKQFKGFKDWLDTFELYRGKNTGVDDNDENRMVGKFKGSLKIYKIPLPKDIEDTTLTGGDPQLGLFQGLPSNEPIKVLVRVYVVKANDLHPADINGKADPYVVIRLGTKTNNDKDNYVSKQLNPIFGKCYEFDATFPMDSSLAVQIYDWDLVGMDDLIGETKIDLENRFYSRHRATCGISHTYELHGYNAWRDPQKPTQILAKLCKENHLDGPHYQPGKVRVGNRVFSGSNEVEDESGAMKATDEHLALAVLTNWSEIPHVGCELVAEHVEIRPLYNPKKPGIEQGKVEMWVDMFPMDMPPPGPPVDISPRKPKSYELRCIIWNTDDVILEDDAFFTGEKMSDIFVKGWLTGPEDLQSTDIHYRSLTGEGNFNWRFIYPFDYLVAEEKIVISRKETILSWDETETKIPPRLNLQVWDADAFSADDFLGSLTLDLNRFPRGAKSAKQCNLDMLKTDGSVPQMNLFKQTRVKGWWPFAVKSESSDEFELTGKVEAELHLMPAEEAEKHPAGLGRGDPDALQKPNRPDTSFIWFLSPLKSLRYIFWNNYKWVLLKLLLFLLIVALLALFFYSMPGYTVKKMFGA